MKLSGEVGYKEMSDKRKRTHSQSTCPRIGTQYTRKERERERVSERERAREREAHTCVTTNTNSLTHNRIQHNTYQPLQVLPVENRRHKLHLHSQSQLLLRS